MVQGSYLAAGLKGGTVGEAVAAGRQCRLKVEAVLDAKAARRKSEKELVAGDVLLAAAGGEDGWLGRCWD